MARIAGVNIPTDKRVVIALTYIYGVGKSRAVEVLEMAEVDQNIRVKDLDADQVHKIRSILEKSFKLEGDLRRDVLQNIKRLKEIGSYRGSRHSKRLTVRGQRTKTNSRTVRGNARHTTGSGRRALTKT